MVEPLILALDEGTTSTRAILFDSRGRELAEAGRPIRQSYPRDGWVEHDAEEIFEASVAVMREAVARSGRAVEEVAALGITNQRETAVVWERATGRPIHPAIVWQDRRTAEACERLRSAGHEPQVTETTGLLLDPYFSGTKLAWLLDRVDARHRRDQRLADAAVRHPPAGLVRADGRTAGRPAFDPAAGAGLRRRLWPDPARASGPGDPDPRRRGRSAGGADGAGMRPPG
jgi:glycerol kinase